MKKTSDQIKQDIIDAGYEAINQLITIAKKDITRKSYDDDEDGESTPPPAAVNERLQLMTVAGEPADEFVSPPPVRREPRGHGHPGGHAGRLWPALEETRPAHGAHFACMAPAINEKRSTRTGWRRQKEKISTTFSKNGSCGT